MSEFTNFLVQQSHKAHKSQFLQPQSLYQRCLHHFFRGEHATALDILSQGVLVATDEVSLAVLYRLWVEVLATDRDKHSLKQLQKHLTRRSIEDNADFWLGLRGLVHLELDEHEGASLVEAQARYLDNPYCLEFLEKFSWRSSESSDLTWRWLRNKQFIHDYFHWQFLNQAFLLRNQWDDLQGCLELTKRVFPESLDYFLFHIHMAKEQQNFTQAADFSDRMLKRAFVPQEAKFLAAFVYIYDFQYAKAVSLLEQLLIDAPLDPDYLNCLGYVYYRLAGRDVHSAYWHQAIECYSRAKNVLEKMGLPSHETEISLDFLHKRHLGKQEQAVSAAPREWLVVLSYRRAHELLAASHASAEYLYQALSDKMQPNDTVLFAFHSANQPSTSAEFHLRLCAVYSVMHEPISSAGQNINALMLIDRFEEAIPLAVPYQAITGRGKKVMRLKKAYLKDLMNQINDHEQNQDGEIDNHEWVKELKIPS